MPRVVFNSVIPLPGFVAINVLGCIFVRRGHSVTPRLLRHEAIHTAQMRELLYAPFYLIYLIEWLLRLPWPGSAYRNVSFEREAYRHDRQTNYLERRPHFAQWRKQGG